MLLFSSVRGKRDLDCGKEPTCIAANYISFVDATFSDVSFPLRSRPAGACNRRQGALQFRCCNIFPLVLITVHLTTLWEASVTGLGTACRRQRPRSTSRHCPRFYVEEHKKTTKVPSHGTQCSIWNTKENRQPAERDVWMLKWKHVRWCGHVA